MTVLPTFIKMYQFARSCLRDRQTDGQTDDVSFMTVTGIIALWVGCKHASHFVSPLGAQWKWLIATAGIIKWYSITSRAFTSSFLKVNIKNAQWGHVFNLLKYLTHSNDMLFWVHNELSGGTKFCGNLFACCLFLTGCLLLLRSWRLKEYDTPKRGRNSILLYRNPDFKRFI
jgi:hypothetical protein